jgi:hypothetical protein
MMLKSGPIVYIVSLFNAKIATVGKSHVTCNMQTGNWTTDKLLRGQEMGKQVQFLQKEIHTNFKPLKSPTPFVQYSLEI